MNAGHIRCTLLAMFVIPIALLTLGGCGKSNPVDGSYTMGGGIMTIRLHAGKADVIAAGTTRAAEYQVSGNTITVRWANGHPFSTFTINSDGSLTDNTGGDRWIKK